MVAGHVFHFRHGWIPLDHTDAGQATGINSRGDVARAVVGLPKIRSEADRRAAKVQTARAARKVGAEDLLPESLRRLAAPTVPAMFKVGETDSRGLHGHDVAGRFRYDPTRVVSYHDPYIQRQLRSARTVDQPEFRVMGGGAASGKSSIIKSGDVQLPDGHVLVNPDDAKESLPEYRAGVAAGDANAAAFVHEESSDMAKRLTTESLRAGHHTVLDGVGNGGVDSLAAKIAKARQDGAKRVVGDYVTVDTEEAVRRATARALRSGRHVPVDVIRHAHGAVSDTFREAAARPGLFDELRLWDNNGPKPRLIYSQVGGKVTVHDRAAYEAFLRKGPGYMG